MSTTGLVTYTYGDIMLLVFADLSYLMKRSAHVAKKPAGLVVTRGCGTVCVGDRLGIFSLGIPGPMIVPAEKRGQG